MLALQSSIHRQIQTFDTFKRVHNRMNLKIFAKSRTLLTVVAMLVSFSLAGQTLKVNRITPAGSEIAQERGIFIEFDRAVVPLGMAGNVVEDVPITITPELDCEWTWVKRNVLACQLTQSEYLRRSTRYEVIIEPEFETEDGTQMTERVSHEFVTVLPAIERIDVVAWMTPTTPIVRVRFNQGIRFDSIRDKVSLVAGDSANAISAEVWPSAWAVPSTFYTNYFAGDDLEGLLDQLRDQALNETDSSRSGYEEWLVFANEEFFQGASMSLRIEPGLLSIHGTESHSEVQIHSEAFKTFDDFQLLAVRCTDINWDDLEFPTTGNTSQSNKRCEPEGVFNIVFSAPVEQHVLSPFLEAQEWFTGRLETDWRLDSTAPWYLSAYQMYSAVIRTVLPPFNEFTLDLELLNNVENDSQSSTLTDVFGRQISGPTEIVFQTDHYSTDVRLSSQVAVLESTLAIDPLIITRNVSRLSMKYSVDSPTVTLKDLAQVVGTSTKTDSRITRSFDLRSKLQASSGVVSGKLLANGSFDREVHEYWFFIQATPYHVLAKQGLFNTYVWVTDLQSGNVVSDAKVQMYLGLRDDHASVQSETFEAITDGSGIAVLPGNSQINPTLKIYDSGYLGACWREECFSRIVRVQGDDGMAVVPLTRDFYIHPSGTSGSRWISTSRHSIYSNLKAWGTTAQGIYRRGEEVQYKLYVRDSDTNSLVAAPSGKYKLQVIGPTWDVLHEETDIQLNSFGAYAGSFSLPSNTTMGEYSFQLTLNVNQEQSEDQSSVAGDGDEGVAVSTELRFFVSDFTPSSFRVRQEFNAESFEQGDEIRIVSRGEFHAGGPYANADVRVWGEVRARAPRFEGPISQHFDFDYSERTNSDRLINGSGSLDENGIFELTAELINSQIYFGFLTTESSVMSDRGKYVATSTALPYFGVDRFVGIRKVEDGFMQAGEVATFESLVVDKSGTPISGVPVNMALQRWEVHTARVRDAGGSYQYQTHREWVEVDQSCSLVSQSQPSECSLSPESAGRYRVVATITDTKGRYHLSDEMYWVTGSGYVNWETNDDHSLEMWCDNKEPGVGDRVQCFVQNSLIGAKALVTIERNGVIDHWLQDFTTSTPVVEFQVKPEYAPGFYLSVVATAPRVEAEARNGESQDSEPLPSTDLGKPTFRMGYTTFSARDPDWNLKVEVSADKEKYEPRQTVHVNLSNAENSSPVEYAVIVLDEAVFDLISRGMDYFDPESGFRTLNSLGVENFSLLNHLVAETPRDLMAEKGMVGGGGGETDTSRNIDAYVAYWNPSIVATNGDASFSFELLDNLTEWRIIVIASDGLDRFGLSSTSVVSTKDTEIRPILPNVVTEGDVFKAGISVLNRTETTREIRVELSATGALKEENETKLRKSLVLEPFDRQQVMFDISSGAVNYGGTDGLAPGLITLKATASDRIGGDSLTMHIPVRSASIQVETVEYGFLDAGQTDIPYTVSPEVVTGSERIEVDVSHNVFGSLDGAFQYVRSYPFNCWEQKLTKGVMAGQFQVLGKDYVSEEFGWEDSDTIAKEMLASAREFQAPNGGMAFFIPQDRYVSPYLSAYTALAFNWLREYGYTPPELVEDRLHEYLLKLLRNNDLVDGYPRNLLASLRAVTLNALVEHDLISDSDLRRYEREIPFMDLFGLAHYLEAIVGEGNNQSLALDAYESIMNYRSFVNGSVEFIDEVQSYYYSMLHSQERSNCAILSALTSYSRANNVDHESSQLAELAITASAYRGKKSHWTNTQDNLYCLNSLIDFTRAVVPESVNFNTTARLNNENTGRATRIGRARLRGTNPPSVRIAQEFENQAFGRSGVLQLTGQGDGRVFYSALLSYMVPGDSEVQKISGMELQRQYFVEREGELTSLEPGMTLQKGELLRSSLFFVVPTSRYFVVVDDSVPGGIEPVNRELGTTSQFDADFGQGEIPEDSNWFELFGNASARSHWYFYHTETGHTNVRFYSEYLPPGKYHLSWVGQVTGTGEFHVTAAHAEEMYRPMVFGKTEPFRVIAVD